MRSARWPLLFVHFTLLTLTSLGSARADCPEIPAPLGMSADQIWTHAQAMTPFLNRVPPVTKTNSGLLPDQTYQTSYGHILGASCLSGSPQERVSVGSKFNAALGNMLGGLQRCLRALPTTSLHLAFYRRFATPIRFECAERACSSPQASACANRAAGLIKFQSKQPLLDEGIVFHEFLHLAGMDNQDLTTHNDHENNGGEDDEVYFWHRACFDTKFVLNSLRSNPNACRSALATLKTQRFRYNDQEVQLICARLESFVAFERAFRARVEQQLAPSVLGCGTEPGCLNASQLNQQLVQAGISDLKLPTQPTEWKDWAHQACAISGTIEQPSGYFLACLGRILDSVQTRLETQPKTASRATLLARLKQINEVSAAFSTSFRLDGVEPEISKLADPHYLDLVVSKCQGDSLKNTEFCNLVRTRFADQLAGYLKYWDTGP